MPAGTTILDACRPQGIDTPTLCFLENLTPVNVCRVCVVESRAPRSCRPARAPSRRGWRCRPIPSACALAELVLEFLGSSVDLSTAPRSQDTCARYGADPDVWHAAAPARGERDAREPGHHEPPDGPQAETVAQPVKVDNDLYVRDYSKCILCYKCVEACGTDAQNTFAIAVAGRGFDARISTEATCRCPIRPASTAATASASVPPAR